VIIYCHNGCGQPYTYIAKNGKYLCGHRPAQCPVIKERMQATSLRKYGVINASSCSAIKKKRKNTMVQKYGVENASHMLSAKKKISDKAIGLWRERHQQKDFTMDGLTRQQYRHRCQQYADTMYRKYKHLLDPENKRSDDWHLDHIYSVDEGFINDVPINVLSDITNLQIISDKDNYKKHRKSGKSLSQLYEDFTSYGHHSRPKFPKVE